MARCAGKQQVSRLRLMLAALLCVQLQAASARFLEKSGGPRRPQLDPALRGPHPAIEPDELERLIGQEALAKFVLDDGEWTRAARQLAGEEAGLLYIVVFSHASYSYLDSRWAGAEGVRDGSLVSKAYAELLLNLLASLRAAGVDRYLVVVPDAASRAALEAAAPDSAPGHVAVEPSFTSNALDFNSQLFLKPLFAMNAAARGYHAVLVDADVAFLSDPTPALLAAAAAGPFDFQAMTDSSVQELWHSSELNTGFLHVSPTPAAVTFLASLLIEAERRAVPYPGGPEFSDQMLFNEMLSAVPPVVSYAGGAPPRPPVAANVLDFDLFANGAGFFLRRAGEKRGARALVVHCNWVSFGAKALALQERGLWRRPLPAARWLSFEPPPPGSPLSALLAAIRAAAALAKASGRGLALPEVPCEHNPLAGPLGLGEGGLCPLAAVLEPEFVPGHLYPALPVAAAAAAPAPPAVLRLQRAMAHAELDEALRALEAAPHVLVRGLHEYPPEPGQGYAGDADLGARLSRALQCAPGNWAAELRKLTGAARPAEHWPWAPDCAPRPHAPPPPLATPAAPYWCRPVCDPGALGPSGGGIHAVDQRPDLWW
eukprot:tig00020563_g11360.t1